jgi:hypothetical protein
MKQDVDSILLANWYFIKCKFDNPKCNKTELARQYLVSKIKKALYDRTVSSKTVTSNKASSISY